MYSFDILPVTFTVTPSETVGVRHLQHLLVSDIL